jgi:ABC-type antimicrobial peptide transport system permease subunit
LITRSRRKEFAILSSMGTSKKTMMTQGILEMAILCLLGAFLGFLLILFWRSVAFGYIGADIALYILCYAIGSFVSIYRSLSIPTINLLRERQ